VLLANAVAVVHALAVLLLLVGGLAALRRPRVLWLHAPVAVAILAVYLAGADCPLTTLELRLRAEAGAVVYDGGFLGHYLFEPLSLDVAATSTQAGIYAVAFGLNALAYGALAVRHFRGPSRASGVLENP
jgi:hypothetical protein